MSQRWQSVGNTVPIRPARDLNFWLPAPETNALIENLNCLQHLQIQNFCSAYPQQIFSKTQSCKAKTLSHLLRTNKKQYKNLNRERFERGRMLLDTSTKLPWIFPLILGLGGERQFETMERWSLVDRPQWRRLWNDIPVERWDVLRSRS